MSENLNEVIGFAICDDCGGNIYETNHTMTEEHIKATNKWMEDLKHWWATPEGKKAAEEISEEYKKIRAIFMRKRK